MLKNGRRSGLPSRSSAADARHSSPWSHKLHFCGSTPGCFRKEVVLSFLALLIATASAASPAQAYSQVAATQLTITDLAPVAVSGVLPGPALWKVTKGTHVMWVLGVTQLLPKKMQWETAAIERAIGNSQVVLEPPGLEIEAHAGFWGRLFLLPSLIGIEKLPDDKTLRDVLSPELYEHWEAQRAKYLGQSQGVERLRPVFAGAKLYAAAIKRSHLTDNGGVVKRVFGFAKHDHVPLWKTSYVFIMQNPRADAKAFKRATMDDQQCLRSILDAAEQGLSQATIRANAWATGDLTALRKILVARQQDECLSALGNTGFAKNLGMTDISQRMRAAWVKAATEALEKFQQTTALLPMQNVLAPDGYLTTLRLKGYTVSAPRD